MKVIALYINLLCAFVLLQSCSLKSQPSDAASESESSLTSFFSITDEAEKVVERTTKKADVEDYVRWVLTPSNGLIKEKIVGDYKFSLQYKPLVYSALLELKKSKKNINKASLAAMIKRFEGLDYYTLHIGSKDGTKEMLKHNLATKTEYFDRVAHFSFQAKRNLSLLENKDTLACKLFHMERDYSVKPYNTFLMGFETSKYNTIANKQFVYTDTYFGLGPIKFTIRKEDLASIPNLKIK